MYLACSLLVVAVVDRDRDEAALTTDCGYAAVARRCRIDDLITCMDGQMHVNVMQCTLTAVQIATSSST